MRRKTPGLDLVERQHQPLDRGLGGGDFGRRHLREVLLLQQLAVGHREARVDLDLTLVAFELAQPGEQRILDALRARTRRLLLARRRLRHERGHQLVEIVAAAEEDAERLVEQLRVLVTLHEHRMQGPVEIRAGADAGDTQRVERVEHRARTDRNPGRAQRTCEVDDVLCQSAVGHRRSHSAARSCVRTSSSNSFALLPSMRAMSS